MSGDALCRAAQPAHIRERPGPESGARPASHRPGLNLSETQDAPPALIFHMAALRSAASAAATRKPGLCRPCISLARNPPVTPWAPNHRRRRHGDRRADRRPL